MRSIALACAVISLSLLLGTRAEAQEEKYNKEAAKKAFLEARRAANKKDWESAAKFYGVAYGESKDPSLFYYMATAYMNGDNCEYALIYFNRFLRESQPKPETKTKTEGFIKTCKEKLGIKDEPKKDPDEGKEGGTGETGGTTGTGTGDTGTGDTGTGDTGTGDQPAGIDPATGLPYGYKEDGTSGETTSSGTSGLRIAGWVSLGLAAAFGAGGTVFALTANAREDDIGELIDFRTSEGQPSRFEGALREEYEDKVDEGDRYSTLSKVAFGAAGVAAAATLVFFIIDGVPDDDSPAESAAGSASLTPTVTPNGGVGVSAGWRF